MTWILKGHVSVASDVTTAGLVAGDGTQTAAAVDARVDARLAGSEIVQEAAAIAAAAAADAAVADEIANGDLMAAVSEVEVPRSLRTVVPIAFRDKTRQVFYPSIYPAIYPAVTWTPGARRSADVPVLGADGLLPKSVIPELGQKVLVAPRAKAVESGPVVFEVREDGKTYVHDLVITSGSGSGGVSRVVIVAMLGQSNNVAYARPVVPMLDGVSERIWQVPYGGSELTPAAVPLTTRDPNGSGLSPSHVLARQIAANDPECVVVIVPAATGGSGLVADTTFGTWSVGYAGSNPRLYQGALDMMAVAQSQIAAKWAIEPTTVTTWLQGEQDGSLDVTRAAYTAALDTLVTDWLTRFGGVFLIAGIVPQTATVGTREDIVLALQDTPRRVEKAAFVPGVDNGGGSRNTTDIIHYGREAVEIIGGEWFGALPRAFNNVAASTPTPPVKVSAARWASTVTVSWSAPYCRVTAYEVESSTDGATWTPVTVTEPVATTVSFTSAVPVKVRVRAVGSGTSAWTVPVFTS